MMIGPAALVAAGFVAGAVVVGGLVYWHLTIRYDLHTYRKVALQAARVREVYASADHEHRLRCRWEAKATELRGAVGDLLDAVAARDRRIARLRRLLAPQRYPMPYGIHRRAS